MNVPEHLKYSEAHAWVQQEGERVLIGITDFAQCELGDIVFVELPKKGDILKAGDPFGSVESVKSVTELYAPVSGKVVDVNTSLSDSPKLLNQSPFQEWMIAVEPSEPAELEQLWNAETYIETYGS